MQLTRKRIRKILGNNRGAASKLARDLGISRVTVALVLSGRTKSKRVLAAADKLAHKLAPEATQ